MIAKKTCPLLRVGILLCWIVGLILLPRPSSAYTIDPGEYGWDGTGLGSASLTYYFGALTSDFNTAIVKSTLVSALGEWARIADITFTETFTSGRDNSIDFLFATGNHGDGFAFDGPGGILAHAFYPHPPNPEPIAGDVHFDDAELWEVGNGLGTAAFDLMWVAVHEIGHALGLGHSTVGSAVMYPYILSTTVYNGLTQDDIDGMLHLYGPANKVPEPSTLLLFGIGLAGWSFLRSRKK